MKLDNLILEALKPSQFRPYMKPDARPNKIIQDELDAKFKAFNGQKNRSGDRIYLPFEIKQPIYTDKQLSLIGTIRDLLMRLGYHTFKNKKDWQSEELQNYKKGICIEDDTGREVRIGKVLNKYKDHEVSSFLDPEDYPEYNKSKVSQLFKLFNEDSIRSNKKQDSFLICISKHPYDIAGMSTDRGWTSCMNLTDGVYKNKIKPLIQEGGLVAYLIKEDDLNIEHPLGRISIYTLLSTKKGSNVYWVPGSRCYGSSLTSISSVGEEFTSSVQKWIKENLVNDKKGIYTFDELSVQYDHEFSFKRINASQEISITDVYVEEDTYSLLDYQHLTESICSQSYYNKFLENLEKTLNSLPTPFDETEISETIADSFRENFNLEDLISLDDADERFYGDFRDSFSLSYPYLEKLISSKWNRTDVVDCLIKEKVLSSSQREEAISSSYDYEFSVQKHFHNYPYVFDEYFPDEYEDLRDKAIKEYYENINIIFFVSINIQGKQKNLKIKY